jgi:hypothetical protein
MTDIKAARRAVIDRYARLHASGRPEFCSPTPKERADGAVRGQSRSDDGKVTYPHRHAAESAAQDFEALDGQPMRAYRCPRSRHGHFHLTVDAVAMARRSGAVTGG